MTNYVFDVEITASSSNWCSTSTTGSIKMNYINRAPPNEEINSSVDDGKVLITIDATWKAQHGFSSTQFRDIIYQIRDRVFKGFTNWTTTYLCTVSTQRFETPFTTNPSKVPLTINGGKMDFQSSLIGTIQVTPNPIHGLFSKTRKPYLTPIYLNDLSQNITPFYHPRRPKGRSP